MTVLALIGLLLVVWLALTVIGAVVKGFFWLAILGLVLFLVTAAFGESRRRNRP